MDHKLKEIMSISESDLGKGSKIALNILEDDKDICYDIALNILNEVRSNNAVNKKTVFIWPVGPVGQYHILARLINKYRISFKNVHVFQMDEYLDENMQLISRDNPLSFTQFIKQNFLSLIDDELRMPDDHHYIPTPGNEKFTWRKIEELNGVDTAYGGIGINGHIAFNEPPEKDVKITDEEFKNLPTRILKITRETRTINSYTTANGAIDLIPEYCITIGMKEILSARKIRFYCNRNWQSGIVRKILHGEVTKYVPASFFQQHPDAILTITRKVAIPPVCSLR